MRKTIRAEATIAASASELFAALADYECAEMFIEGLERLSPVTSQTTGKDAEFEAVLKVGVRTLETRIVIGLYEPDRAITWSSAGQDGQNLIFQLEPIQDGTAVTLQVSYQEPGGLAGALLAPFVERTVQHRADTALERLRDHLSPRD